MALSPVLFEKLPQVLFHLCKLDCPLLQNDTTPGSRCLSCARLTVIQSAEEWRISHVGQNYERNKLMKLASHKVLIKNSKLH